MVADEKYVVVASRDLEDQRDFYQCFDAESGQPLWQHLSEAPGNLDYGNAPRATPLIYEGFVYVVGAFGDVICLELETGVPLWNKHLVRDFQGKLPDWGFSASPILVDDQLIVQPGGSRCAIAALDPITGEVAWQAEGNGAVYASLILQEVNGTQLLIGLDSLGAGAWDAKSGKNLWKSSPRVGGDFGVPSPVTTSAGWLVTSENNGARWFPFGSDMSLPNPDPAAVNDRASPDANTPVVVDDRVYVADDRLYALDLSDKLKTAWRIDDRAFRGYASLIASNDRLLAFTESGELILIECQPKSGRIFSRLRLTNENARCLSHPALVGNRLYIRFGRTLARVDL